MLCFLLSQDSFHRIAARGWGCGEGQRWRGAAANQQEWEGRMIGSGFLTWEVSPEFLQAGKDWRETWWPGRKERHRKGRLNGLE